VPFPLLLSPAVPLLRLLAQILSSRIAALYDCDCSFFPNFSSLAGLVSFFLFVPHLITDLTLRSPLPASRLVDAFYVMVAIDPVASLFSSFLLLGRPRRMASIFCRCRFFSPNWHPLLGSFSAPHLESFRSCLFFVSSSPLSSLFRPRSESARAATKTFFQLSFPYSVPFRHSVLDFLLALKCDLSKDLYPHNIWLGTLCFPSASEIPHRRFLIGLSQFWAAGALKLHSPPISRTFPPKGFISPVLLPHFRWNPP